MLKKFFIVLTILFLFSCGDDNDSPECYDRGLLCSKHKENYLLCRAYEYYHISPYPNTDHVSVYVNNWYQVKNNDGEWTMWEDYSEMYNFYCR